MTTPAPYFEGRSRLAWLIRLRWLALLGVSLAAAFAALGVVPGVNLPLVAAAVAMGVFSNVALARFGIRRGEGVTDTRHVGQALLDTGALTLVVWAAGGADCPFIGFYAFPMLLAALLGDRRGLLPTGLGTLAGMTFQVAATRVPALRAGAWDPQPQYASALELLALGLTVGGVAYFARVFAEASRAQEQARREADTLLALSLEGLDVSLEVVEHGRVAWQNAGAIALLGQRRGAAWRCPAADAACARGACPAHAAASQSVRCTVNLQSEDPDARVFEMLRLPLGEPTDARSMVMYLDRTLELRSQRQWVFTERLASLGRTVQGVAHELNTPLSTIRLLARDLEQALAPLALEGVTRADLEESTRLIVAEVERCSRITHALLGRVDPSRATEGKVPLGDVVSRAVAVVSPQDRERVRVAYHGDVAARGVAHDPLVQVLVNLLQNATDAAPNAPIELAAGEAHEGQALVVTVRDHGPGLSPAARARLFEPFYTSKPVGQGTGLGLFTSYTLLQALGGAITLDDHPDGGALATVRVPVTRVSAEQPAAVSAPSSAAFSSQ